MHSYAYVHVRVCLYANAYVHKKVGKTHHEDDEHGYDLNKRLIETAGFLWSILETDSVRRTC